MRAQLFYLAGGFNKVDRVVVVLFNAGGHRKNIRVKNNVFGRKTNLRGQDVISALANFDFAHFGIGLAFFVKGHYYHGRTIAAQ